MSQHSWVSFIQFVCSCSSPSQNSCVEHKILVLRNSCVSHQILVLKNSCVTQFLCYKNLVSVTKFWFYRILVLQNSFVTKFLCYKQSCCGVPAGGSGSLLHVSIHIHRSLQISIGLLFYTKTHMSPNSCVSFFAGWRGSLLYASLHIQRSLFISIGLFPCKYDSFVAPERGGREHIPGMQLLRVCCPCERYGIWKCVILSRVWVYMCAYSSACVCVRERVGVCTCVRGCGCVHVGKRVCAHIYMYLDPKLHIWSEKNVFYRGEHVCKE